MIDRLIHQSLLLRHQETQRRCTNGQEKPGRGKRGNSIYPTHKIFTYIKEIREAFPIQVNSSFVVK